MVFGTKLHEPLLSDRRRALLSCILEISGLKSQAQLTKILKVKIENQNIYLTKSKTKASGNVAVSDESISF